MIQEQTHYDVLGVAEDAPASDIKRAFYTKVREHPPERDPEAYKAVREAYDVLYNPVSRKEYDNMASYGAEIKKLEDEAKALLAQEPPDARGAIRKLKRAVVLGPDIGLLRNLLGNAYLLDEAPSDALRQFDKAVELDEFNPTYQLNRGHAQRAMGDLRGAERTFRAVWNEDQGDYAVARALANVHFQKEEYDAAHRVLDAAIWDDGKLDFEDFFCYHDKLEYLVLQGKTDKLEEELETVVGLPETQDDRQFASFMLGRIGAQLYEVNAFRLSERFIDAAQTLDPGNSALAGFAGNVRKLSGLEKDVDAVLEDERVNDLVRHMVAVYYGQAIGDLQDPETRHAEIAQALDNVMQADPEHTQTKQSLRRIRRRYAEAYKLNEGLFDAVLELPATDMFAAPCPHCESIVVAHKRRDRGAGACTGCSKPIYFDGKSITAGGRAPETTSRSGKSDRSSRRASSRSTSSAKAATAASSQKTGQAETESDSGAGGCFIVIAVIVFLFFMAQSCG